MEHKIQTATVLVLLVDASIVYCVCVFMTMSYLSNTRAHFQWYTTGIMYTYKTL